MAEGIVESHDVLQKVITTADETNLSVEEARSVMEKFYDWAAEEMQPLPTAERRDFLESIRAYLDDDSDDPVIRNFIAAMNERDVHIEIKELHLEP